MIPKFRASQAYELLARTSLDSESASLDEENASGFSFPAQSPAPAWYSLPRWHALSSKGGSTGGGCSQACSNVLGVWRRPRRTLRWVLWTLAILPEIIFLLVFFATALFPSYTNPPVHYVDIRSNCLTSGDKGRGNVNNEKVFIAASVYDEYGSLTGGRWGEQILELVDLLGPDNVHVSIYENDPDSLARASLEEFGGKLTCNSTLVAEHLPLDDIQRITISTDEKLLKRIAYLAEVRNRALRPLDTDLGVQFDKLLFVNDVYFDPVEIAQLLFATNVDESGRTNYRAACAVDFINPFKFYDTFATRDLEGYSMGIPFFPWFTPAGHAASRNDVLSQKDAVRVRSCWGGIIAFEAKWFQSQASNETDLAVGGLQDIAVGSENLPVRFRAEKDPYWDASECCLINADLQKHRDPAHLDSESGIFMNPYVRVAYDEYTLTWLPLTRRPERLYSLIHNILTRAVGRPGYNPRRLEEPGNEVIERVWHYDNESSSDDGAGYFEEVTRTAPPGRYCGSKKLLVLNEHPAEGESRWIKMPIPVDA